jgi:hypothetical protein
MANAGDIIKDALQDLGKLSAGQSPSTEDNADALRRLNKILDLWSTTSLLIPFRTQVIHTLDGSESYTIGSGGDIDTTRPTTIESAFVTLQDSDYDLYVSRDRREYDAIFRKEIVGIPRFLYYEPEIPLGRVFIYYVGDATYTLTMSTRGVLTTFPDTTTEVFLAPGYESALEYNLAVACAPMYEMEPPASVVALSIDSTAKIKRLNRQSPVMEYGAGIPRGTNGRFNINAGF